METAEDEAEFGGVEGDCRRDGSRLEFWDYFPGRGDGLGHCNVFNIFWYPFRRVGFGYYLRYEEEA